MILIAHRGNINGRDVSRENHPDYVDNAICLGYDVEIDVWLIGDEFFLGHDAPQYKIAMDWIGDRSHRLWVHCKNTSALEFLNKCNYSVNYFWHEADTATLTSKKYIWAYPGKQPIKDSVAVMPEWYGEDVTTCAGICSDYIQNYKI